MLWPMSTSQNGKILIELMEWKNRSHVPSGLGDLDVSFVLENIFVCAANEKIGCKSNRREKTSSGRRVGTTKKKKNEKKKNVD